MAENQQVHSRHDNMGGGVLYPLNVLTYTVDAGLKTFIAATHVNDASLQQSASG